MRIFRLLPLIGLLAAPPATAGEVYIPFLAADPPGVDSGRSTVPMFDLHNLGRVPRRYSVRVTPAGDDGTKVRELVFGAPLDAGAFAQGSCCNRESGLLVVSGAPQIAVGARLALVFDRPQSNALITRMPALTVRDALRAGSTGVLPGLATSASGTIRSSLGILNFARVTAVCAIEPGTGFFDRFYPEFGRVVVPPLSVAAFPDVFDRIRGPQGANLVARTRVTCNQPFYPFGVTFAGDLSPLSTGLPWVEFVLPALQLGSAP